MAAAEILSKLTEEQHRAVAMRDFSVALAAGAGCGKTHVLTERYLSHLAPGVGGVSTLPELVAFTFTEKAAREMRQRIRQSCLSRAMSPKSDDADHWLGILRELETARISTIHSFCASLLRAHAVEAGLDPHFTLLDEARAALVLSEVLKDSLRMQLAGGARPLLALAARLGGVSMLRRHMVKALAKRHCNDIEAWLGKSADDVLDVWEQQHRDLVVPAEVSGLLNHDATMRMRKIFREQRCEHEVMRRRIAFLQSALEELPRSKDPLGALRDLVEQARVQGGGNSDCWPSAEIYENVRTTLEAFRDRCKKALQKLAFDREAARPAAEAGVQLLQIIAPVARAYQERKRELSALDFDDLLTRTADLLDDPRHKSLRDRAARQIKLLLVDEFQDTDPVQVRIVKALCGKELASGKLFFVGDHKQSIYRFRGADPGVFRNLRTEISACGRLPLTLNFRSQPQILYFVNALFADALGDYEPLRPHRPQVTTPPAVEFMWALDPRDADGEEPAEESSADSQRRREAQWIARRLRALIESGEPLVWDKEAEKAKRPAARAVRPGDIAILFRAMTDVQLYERALQDEGLDYYVVGGAAFYAQQEIYDVLNLLKAVADPLDEVALVGVLRSPFFSLSDEAIFHLASHARGLSGALFSLAPVGLDDVDRPRVNHAAKVLRHLRVLKDHLPIAGLLQEALRLTGYDALLLAEYLGERKLANLHKLIDRARMYDRDAAFTLADFLHELQDSVENEPKEAPAATQSESAQVVRLMSIHQAKGLEFPVVVVPDLARREVQGGAESCVDCVLGPLVKLPDTDNTITGQTILRSLQAEEERQERLRLLYVACTRAADYLILSAGLKNLNSPSVTWMKLLAERFDLSTGKLLATLPKDHEAPAIRVTLAPPKSKGAPRKRRPNLLALVETAREQAAAETGSEGLSSADLIGPVPPDKAARREFSFSRLNAKLHPRSHVREEDAPRDERIDPLGLGTIVHDILEYIDLRRPLAPNDVRDLVARRARSHGVGKQEARQAEDMLARFLASPRAHKLAQAKTLHRELEFLLAWPPDGATTGEFRHGAADHAPPRYLHGFIDCLYEDARGRWHLLDFKTNQVTEETLEATAALYEMQMLVYALAAESVLGKPPDSIALYLLRLGVEARFTLDAAARKKVIRDVTAAMGA